MLDDCPWGGEMVKTKFFMKCMMKKKIKTCMRYDIKQKLEENFGQVDNVRLNLKICLIQVRYLNFDVHQQLVEETKIPENQLYEIVKMMLKGPEKMMMEMS